MFFTSEATEINSLLFYIVCIFLDHNICKRTAASLEKSSKNGIFMFYFISTPVSIETPLRSIDKFHSFAFLKQELVSHHLYLKELSLDLKSKTPSFSYNWIMGYGS